MDVASLLFVAVQDSSSGGEVADWMQRWLNVSRPWELWWIALGVMAQLVFFGRWVIQWIASERRGESYMPTIFWWCSLIGATMLLIYFIGRREPVGVMGQLIGWTVYSRNLYLIRAGRRRITPEMEMDVDEPLPITDSDEPTRLAATPAAADKLCRARPSEPA